MGARNFLEHERSMPDKIPKVQRRGDFSEIYEEFTLEKAQEQASRCIDCGNPYCQIACPVHNYIPNWLTLISEGNIKEAAIMSHKTSSLPEICGRICPQDKLCEGACTLEHTDFGAVTIGAIEKFITDTAFNMGFVPEVVESKTLATKRISIIGAGPAGLACADVLARNGVKSLVYDKQPNIGGLLTFGIPQFKLDKEIVGKRKNILEKMGVSFKLGSNIGVDVDFKEIYDKSDAVFIATGTYKYMQAGIEGENLDGVYCALDYLVGNVKRELNYDLIKDNLVQDKYINLKNKKVVVLGGGDTSMDCTRTAIRQGADEVLCIYRRDEASAPGSKTEINNAKEEGVKFIFNESPVKISRLANGRLGLSLAKTESVDTAEGKKLVVRKELHTHFETDAIIIAFGFLPSPPSWLRDFSVQLDEKGLVKVDYEVQNYQSSNEKIFVGGDMVLGSSLVVQAIAQGRDAAENILDFLG